MTRGCGVAPGCKGTLFPTPADGVDNNDNVSCGSDRNEQPTIQKEAAQALPFYGWVDVPLGWSLRNEADEGALPPEHKTEEGVLQPYCSWESTESGSSSTRAKNGSGIFPSNQADCDPESPLEDAFDFDDFDLNHRRRSSVQREDHRRTPLLSDEDLYPSRIVLEELVDKLVSDVDPGFFSHRVYRDCFSDFVKDPQSRFPSVWKNLETYNDMKGLQELVSFCRGYDFDQSALAKYEPQDLRFKKRALLIYLGPLLIDALQDERLKALITTTAEIVLMSTNGPLEPPTLVNSEPIERFLRDAFVHLARVQTSVSFSEFKNQVLHNPSLKKLTNRVLVVGLTNIDVIHYICYYLKLITYNGGLDYIVFKCAFDEALKHCATDQVLATTRRATLLAYHSAGYIKTFAPDAKWLAVGAICEERRLHARERGEKVYQQLASGIEYFNEPELKQLAYDYWFREALRCNYECFIDRPNIEFRFVFQALKHNFTRLILDSALSAATQYPTSAETPLRQDQLPASLEDQVNKYCHNYGTLKRKLELRGLKLKKGERNILGYEPYLARSLHFLKIAQQEVHLGVAGLNGLLNDLRTLSAHPYLAWKCLQFLDSIKSRFCPYHLAAVTRCEQWIRANSHLPLDESLVIPDQHFSSQAILPSGVSPSELTSYIVNEPKASPGVSLELIAWYINQLFDLYRLRGRTDWTPLWHLQKLARWMLTDHDAAPLLIVGLVKEYEIHLRSQIGKEVYMAEHPLVQICRALIDPDEAFGLARTTLITRIQRSCSKLTKSNVCIRVTSGGTLKQNNHWTNVVTVFIQELTHQRREINIIFGPQTLSIKEWQGLNSLRSDHPDIDFFKDPALKSAASEDSKMSTMSSSSCH